MTAYPDGPLILRGDFEIVRPGGEPIPAGRRTVALCRCGHSALQPFCDGSHVRAGFRAQDNAGGASQCPQVSEQRRSAVDQAAGVPDPAADAAGLGQPAA